jgi:predicted transcriptional regulator
MVENADVISLKLPAEIKARLSDMSHASDMDESSYATKVIIDYLKSLSKEASDVQDTAQDADDGHVILE